MLSDLVEHPYGNVHCRMAVAAKRPEQPRKIWSVPRAWSWHEDQASGCPIGGVDCPFTATLCRNEVVADLRHRRQSVDQIIRTAWCAVVRPIPALAAISPGVRSHAPSPRLHPPPHSRDLTRPCSRYCRSFVPMCLQRRVAPNSSLSITPQTAIQAVGSLWSLVRGAGGRGGLRSALVCTRGQGRKFDGTARRRRDGGR
jgi:hypothetical protein